MICPHCKQQIAEGSNICPLCFSSLAGYSAGQDESELTDDEPRSSRSSGSYRKGSRGKRRRNSAPTIVAIGIIIILLVVILLIVKSMFSTPTSLSTSTPTPQPRATLEGNFVVFGATAVPSSGRTATPNVAVTATPVPAQESTAPVAETSYKTLRKGDQSVEVVLLQEALASLGYLTTASDGIYGTGTVTAVKAFQSDNGLDSDGIAGRQTQAKLFEIANITPVPSTTPAPGEILDLPG